MTLCRRWSRLHGQVGPQDGMYRNHRNFCDGTLTTHVCESDSAQCVPTMLRQEHTIPREDHSPLRKKCSTSDTDPSAPTNCIPETCQMGTILPFPSLAVVAAQLGLALRETPSERCSRPVWSDATPEEGPILSLRSSSCSSPNSSVFVLGAMFKGIPPSGLDEVNSSH